METHQDVRPWHRYSDGLAAVICHRLAQGQRLMELCRDPEMPSRATVQLWSKRRPEFRARLLVAVRQGRHRAGRPSTYDPAVAGLICERVAQGMTLRQACELDGMPGDSTVWGWLRRRTDFQENYARARILQAHRRMDEVWEIAQQATAKTTNLARVRIEAARWQASRLAPKRYGLRAEVSESVELAVQDGWTRRAVKAATRREEENDLIVEIRRFGDDSVPAAGGKASPALALGPLQVRERPEYEGD